jgi:hypothetical protein
MPELSILTPNEVEARADAVAEELFEALAMFNARYPDPEGRGRRFHLPGGRRRAIARLRRRLVALVAEHALVVPAASVAPAVAAAAAV